MKKIIPLLRPAGILLTREPLPPLDETLLIPNDVANLDDVACNVIIQDFDCLTNRNASSEQLDHVSRLEDNVRVVCFTRCPNGHGTMDEIKGACDTLAETLRL